MSGYRPLNGEAMKLTSVLKALVRLTIQDLIVLAEHLFETFPPQ